MKFISYESSLNSSFNLVSKTCFMKQKNRKIDEQKITAAKEKIEKRRHQVYLLHLQNFTNQQIAEKLDVSLSTIEKDLHEIKNYTLKLYRMLYETGMIEYYVNAIHQLLIIQKELWVKYREWRVEERISCINKIADISLKICNMFGLKPNQLTKYAFQQFVKGFCDYDTDLHKQATYEARSA